jgi:hypothetical protein
MHIIQRLTAQIAQLGAMQVHAHAHLRPKCISNAFLASYAEKNHPKKIMIEASIHAMNRIIFKMAQIVKLN